MKHIYANRLLKLAEYLESLPRKVFDFNVWGIKDDCGTTACALGHACMMPTFKRLGASLENGHYDSAKSKLYLIPKIGGMVGEYAVGRELFGLDIYDVDRLFIPGDQDLGLSGLPKEATPKQVAEHIRKFVAEKQAVAA